MDHPFLQKLEEYLKNTPKEQIDKDWSDILKETDSEAYFEKKYNAALERARELSKTITGANYEYIFPELKESEDEKIRKTLIEYIKGIKSWNYFLGISKEQMIAWLERQGEKRPTENVEIKFCEGDKVVSNQDGKVYTVGTEYYVTGDNICLHAADGNPGNHKWTNRDDLDKNYHLWTSEETDLCIGCTNDKGCVTCDNGNLKEIKIEPKFKVGDWITTTDEEGNVTTEKIIEFLGDKVRLIDTNGFYTLWPKHELNYYHIWTINDAKDGDVLWHSDSASNGIFVFKEIRYDGKVLCYCDYDSEDHFCTGEHHTCCWSNDKYIKPANKEQRDLLFAKMRESGYEWDAEKKELKKIESKKLDPDEVIEWLNNQACLGWIEDVEVDKFVEKFKKDFGL